LSTGATFNTPSISSTTTYYVQSGLNCPSARTPVTATVNAVPANPVTTDGSRCGPGSVNLSAVSADPVSWYDVSTGGSSLGTGNNFSTPGISTTTVFYAEANNANCPSARVPVQANIDAIPASPVTASAQRCGTGTLTLTATAADPVNWYDASAGGTLLATGPSFTTPVITATTIYYAETDNGKCQSPRIPVTATITTSGVDPMINSVVRCGPGTATLNAVSQDPVTWYDAPSGGTVLATGNTFVTPVLNATTTYYAQSGVGSCTSNMVSVTVTVNPAAVEPVTVSGQHCGPGVITLTANSTDPIIWYDSPTGGNQVGNGTSFTTPFLANTMNYYAQSFRGLCQSTRVSAIAEILSIPSLNLGPDTAINGTSFTLDAGPGMASYLWNTGETTQTITATSSDTFCVTVTSSENCTNQDCIFIDLITGLSGTPLNSILTVAPNPSGGLVKITLPAFQNSRPELKLFDVEGKMIRRISAEETVIDLDLQTYSRGIYFLEVRAGNQSAFRKIILQ
jgi:hypothetical protein